MGVRVRQKIKGKGKPWWVFISHNKRRTSKKVGDKQAAEKVASTIRAKLKLDDYDFEDPKKTPTFKEHADLWFSLPHPWKESTKANYLFNMNRHVFPVLGSKPIDQIKRRDIKLFFDKLLAEGVSSGTVRLVRAPMTGIMGHALDSELIDHNPMTGIKLAGN